MVMGLNKEIERIKSNISNLSEDEFFEILKECGFGRILPTEKIFEQLDVREIVHAKWIDTQPDYHNGYGRNAHKCSNCNDYYTTEYEDLFFCPRCGAKMDLK